MRGQKMNGEDDERDDARVLDSGEEEEEVISNPYKGRPKSSSKKREKYTNHPKKENLAHNKKFRQALDLQHLLQHQLPYQQSTYGIICSQPTTSIPTLASSPPTNLAQISHRIRANSTG